MRIFGLLVLMPFLLAACGDPLSGVEKVSDGAAIPDEPSSAALPSQAELDREASVLAGLFPSTTEPRVSEDAASGVPSLEEGAAAEVAATETPKESPARQGVFGWLKQAATSEAAAETAQAQSETPEGQQAEADTVVLAKAADADTKIVATDASTAPAQDLVEPAKRRGLFGMRATPPNAGMALADVEMGTPLPFGEVGRVCDLRMNELGDPIDVAAGNSYRLYDSAPNAPYARTFYVTGFKDNCARQFTASLAIFGAPAFHEQLRYGLPAEEYPYSSTDQAYEKVKNGVCNAKRNAPCGSKMARLEKNTAFISVYENFGENARWSDMLLHDGALLAAAVKTP